VLPGAAYTEKDGTYMNLEGRAQLAMLAIFPPGEAKGRLGDPARAVREARQAARATTTLDQLRAKLYQANKRFQRLNRVEPAAWEAFGKPERPTRSRSNRRSPTTT
jgi:NADH-quinone oxidoreductase subunit G